VSASAPDFGQTADDYARHRAGFPEQLVQRLRESGIVWPGARAVDVGTGTGSLARLLAAGGCEVTAVDIAAPLLEQARRLDAEAGVRIAYVHARAEQTGLPARSYDLACAGQCWHWFDRPAAAAELRRLLRAGASALIAHFDWLPLTGNVVQATEDVILRHSPRWQFAKGTGLYPQWLTDLREAGFEAVQTFSFDIDVAYTHESWIGRLRASAPILGTLPHDAVQPFCEDMTALLRSRFAAEPLLVPHRVWAVTARAPS
jgi:ubiquinone/menaquinone biosynthesis C-methylase UbiE